MDPVFDEERKQAEAQKFGFEPANVVGRDGHAGGSVLSNVGWAEIPREQAKAPLAPEVNLPEPVAGGVVALEEDGIAGATRVNVRNAPLIDDEFSGLLQATHLMAALPYRG